MFKAKITPSPHQRFSSQVNSLLKKSLMIVCLGLLLVATVFYWSSARDEVYYLCSNFTEGVPFDSVRRQLDTGHFLHYQRLQNDSLDRIEVSSWLNFNRYRCTIVLDDSAQVVTATFH